MEDEITEKIEALAVLLRKLHKARHSDAIQ
jgi:hypothetical protein